MLVLFRKQKERIVVGTAIVITVVRIGAGKVRLGIEAPADLTVFREELAWNTAPLLEQERPSLARIPR